MARPKKPDSEKKKNTVRLYLTDAQLKHHNTNRAKTHLQLAPYLEKLLSEREPKFIGPELRDFTVAINKVGKNINHIARKLEGLEGTFRSDVIQEELRKSIIQMSDTLKHVRNQ